MCKNKSHIKNNIKTQINEYNTISKSFCELIKIIRTLRSPEGCPWDREQTLYSLKNHFIEEAYELVDALDNRDIDNIKEELGDLLLHIVIHSVIAEEDGYFNLNEVIQEISEKLIRRHPHVFSDLKVDNTDDVMKHWEAIKVNEGKTRKSIFDGIPKSLPSVQNSYKIQKRAAKTGFNWNSEKECMEKVDKELSELKSALESGDKNHIEHEFGDTFFALINLARIHNIDPDESIRKVNQRFKKRFNYIEKKLSDNDISLNDAESHEIKKLWEEAKKQ